MLNKINGVRSSKFLMLRTWYDMLVLDDMIVMFSSGLGYFKNTFYFGIVYWCFLDVFYWPWFACFTLVKNTFVSCMVYVVCLCEWKVCYVLFLAQHMSDVWCMCILWVCMSLLCWDCSCHLGDTIITYSSWLYKDC